MNLPKQIKVGWKVFQVVEWDPVGAAVARRYGECDHLRSEIRIDVTHGAMQAAETLLHECLHAAWFLAGVDESSKDGKHSEEYMVLHHASWLTTLFVDNPDFLDFFKSSIHLER